MNTNENTAKPNEPILDSRNSDEPRQYKDTAGNPCSLDWLVKNEPEWAANQIRHRDKLERELAAERSAKEQAIKAIALLESQKASFFEEYNKFQKRAEQAEARLATVGDVLVNRYNEGRHLMNCGAETLACVRQIQDFLSSTTPPPLVGERDALKIEYESRAAWIAEMNKILGYDNADGFHSEPSPHEIARQMKAELERLRAMEAHHKLFPVLDAKWLDPECHNGCQSLVFKHRAEAAEKEREALRAKLQAAREALKYFVRQEVYQTVSPFALPIVLYDGHSVASKALAQLDAEQCSHDAAYYNPGADKFYCIHCKVGMGEAFHKVAKENMALEVENKSLRAAMSAEGGSK